MRSNDSIPEDEMLLAAAFAAAQDGDLGWTQGTPFRDIDNNRVTDPADAAACCALGALHIAGRVRIHEGDYVMSRRHPLGNVHAGNDRPLSFNWSGMPGDRGESLGWAFRCAMTQTESDPETEWLIRERSGK